MTYERKCDFGKNEKCLYYNESQFSTCNPDGNRLFCDINNYVEGDKNMKKAMTQRIINSLKIMRFVNMKN